MELLAPRFLDHACPTGLTCFSDSDIREPINWPDSNQRQGHVVKGTLMILQQFCGHA